MSELHSKILTAIESVIRSKDDSRTIPLHEPSFDNTNAWKYVKSCIDTGWVSSAGDWVTKFENKICSYTGSKYAVVVNNGTVGLRLALHVIGVKFGDEILVPPYSFVATVNAISHLGAIPHFVDVEESTFSMCPKALNLLLERIAFRKDGKIFNRETGRRIAAIMPVHVFGIPADLISLSKISKTWGIPMVEDTAEALGSWLKVEGTKIHCGLKGDLGVISFNGNKLITTGGGGVLITNNEKFANHARHLSTTAKVSHPWEFDHDEIGWNDRMPNLNAALGYSQLEVLEERLLRKKELLEKYKSTLNHINQVSFVSPRDGSISNNWLITIVLNLEDQSIVKKERDELLKQSHKRNILLRPLWKPLHKLEIYKQSPKGCLSNANKFEYSIINLPSSPQLIK